MFKSVKAFSEGLKYHIKGIRFGFKNPSFMALAALPFIVTLTLYLFGFYLFTTHVDTLVQMVWKIEPGESSSWMGWIYWAYTHVVTFILYAVVLAVSFYTFVIIANILASPFYDRVSEKYECKLKGKAFQKQSTSFLGPIFLIMKEEIKKAGFMLIIPLLLFLIPVVGSVLGFVVAAIFIAWDYIDFSLSRHCPLLRERIGVLWCNKLRLFGFGFPLLIPFLGILILPFAILGSTMLYFDRIHRFSP